MSFGFDYLEMYYSQISAQQSSKHSIWQETGKAAISSILRPDKSVILSNKEELENYVRSHNLPPIDLRVFDFKLNTEAETPAAKSPARQIMNNAQEISDKHKECLNAHDQLNPDLQKETTGNAKDTVSSVPSFQKLELRKMKIGNKVVLAPTIPGKRVILAPTAATAGNSRVLFTTATATTTAQQDVHNDMQRWILFLPRSC